MKICPMCGSDILASDTGSKCSSCGGNLSPATEAPSSGAKEGTAPKESESQERVLDDSQPIMHTDLDVVQSGHAFWTEPAATDNNDDTDPDGVRASKPPEPETRTSEKTNPESEPKKTFVFEAERTNADAPSLAELARRRKAQLIETGFAGAQSEIRHDHVTLPEAKVESAKPEGDVVDATAPAAQAEPTKPEIQATAPMPDQNSAVSESTEPARRVPSLDDTQPAGVRAEAGGLASVPVPGIATVAKSPDIAYIDDQKLSIPGVKWASGERVVVGGRTYELRRKIAKYPVSPREMLIGTGSFLGGLIIAWMIIAGGGGGKSALFGVVRAGDTGKLLAGVTVALEETNQTFQSDPSGMFYVNEIPGGIYTLIATDPIYGSTRKSITVAGDATSIMMELERPDLADLRPDPAPVKKTTRTRPAAESNSEEVSNSAGTGELAVEAEVSNARVFLDGKLLGVGNAVYSEINPGKHKIEVTHDGFEKWSRTLTFAAGKVTRLNPDLTPIKQAEPVRLSAEEYATQGRKSIEAKNYKIALEQFAAAINIDQRPQYYAWRAEAFVGLKDLSHAEADFIRAIDLFNRSGENTRLEGLVERAVLVVPASAALWLTRGDYMYSQRKLHDAEKSYRRALVLGADAAVAHTGIGLTQYAGGSFQEAFDSWTLADEASGQTDPHLAGYLALAAARLQYRASCRDAVKRLANSPDVLTQFRAHPDWDKVQRLAGQG